MDFIELQSFQGLKPTMQIIKEFEHMMRDMIISDKSGGERLIELESFLKNHKDYMKVANDTKA